MRGLEVTSLPPILNYINETVDVVPKLPLATSKLSKPLLDTQLYETVHSYH